MNIIFLAMSDESNPDETINAWKVDKIYLEGGTLVDRVLEDVEFEISKKPDGTLAFRCPKPKDQAYLKDICMSMDALWEKTKTYLVPWEECFYAKDIDSQGRMNNLMVELWDQNTPLASDLVHVEKP